MAVFAATPAFAQAQPTPSQPDIAAPPASNPEERTAQAINQTTATSPGDASTGDIVVTARRRAESLKDVPIAVTAITGAQLDKQGAIDITDVAQSAPNVTLEVSRGTNSTLTAFIRGVGQQDPVAGFEQGVGIYLDDVYLNRPQGAVLDIYDVDRIEVLRGPQGTLYGRNTIGGAVKYVTRRLANRPTISARLDAGTHDMVNGVVSGSLPIADWFRIGGAVARLTRDGYGRNLTTGYSNYDKDVTAARVSAEFGTSDDLMFRINADHTRDDSSTRGGHRLIPGQRSGAPVLADVFDSQGGLVSPKQKVVSKGVDLHGQWTFAEGLTFKSITAWRKDNSATPIDFDALAAVDVDVPAFYRNRQFSQELQLQVNKGPLQGVLGGYYLNAKAFTAFDVRLFTTVAGLAALTQGNVETKAWALFGDFTYNFTPQFALSAGLRYTNDKRHSTIFRQNYLGGGSPLFSGAGVPFGAPTSNFDGRRKDDAFTPRVSLSFKPNADNTFYASYAQGFKGGGFDPRGLSTQAPDTNNNGVRDYSEQYNFLTFKPEKVRTEEVGYKASLFDRRIYTAVALFNADYKDVQIPGSAGTVVNGLPTFVGITTNAAKARIRGVEWEGDARLFGNAGGSRMNFGWSLGYLDAKYQRYTTLLTYAYVNGVLTRVAPYQADVSDFRKIQNTPKWTASGTLNYTTPFVGGELNLNSTLSYRSKSQQFELATPGLDQKGYSLLDANAVLNLGPWTLGLHGRNLTNKKYVVAGYNFLNQNPFTGQFIRSGSAVGSVATPGIQPTLGTEGVLTGYYGNPRQLWASIGLKF
ncbi:TonB-dependent receptor [Sphingomonas ginkgonis]|uniref:TonB-dependent receptor n=2 Tax=Sphingomonas ginkgonis TaxID=2315330 RepID=A0A3R9WQS0_9SPHN|nr:TonB-dependent receptor [Sphingomonas ginkgonis]